MSNIIHNDVIRKIVLAFGNLFSQIPLVRYKDEDTNEVERFIISLIYAPKEQYVHRLNDDPELNARVQVVIPSLSYEMMGMSYDASRKQITNMKNFSQNSEGTLSQYNPVPYNFDFDLHLYSRTFEDAHQVVEHIISYFTPDYTIKVNLIPSMGIVKELPIILNSVDRDVTYEGDREDNSRRIIFSFHFTVKGFIFGKITDVTDKLITHTITNVYNKVESIDEFEFALNNSGFGTYKTKELIYQGVSASLSSASAEVVRHDTLNNILHITNITGDFVSSLPLIGSQSNAKYLFTSYSPAPGKMAKIDVTVDPPGANVSSNWTANTSITEYI
jgi:hypothetical protein